MKVTALLYRVSSPPEAWPSGTRCYQAVSLTAFPTIDGGLAGWEDPSSALGTTEAEVVENLVEKINSSLRRGGVKIVHLNI